MTKHHQRRLRVAAVRRCCHAHGPWRWEVRLSGSVSVLRRVLGGLLLLVMMALIVVAIGVLVWTLADRGVLDPSLFP